jgi:hypothetical protein
VLGLTAAIGVLLRQRFYYGNDDLLEFAAAREKGLSWSYLSLNVWEHFAPYNRLIHYVVLRFSDLSPGLGLALVLMNVTALLAACLWLMSELRLSAPRRVVALIVVALSVPTAESALWFDTGSHIIAAIAVTLAVCAAHVRGLRTGARRWHVLATVLFALGQLTQERPVFALPLLVLVDVLLVWRELPWGERFRRLWGLRLPLAALTAVAAVIVAALQAFVVLDHLGTPSWGVTGRMMLSALTNYAAPSLVNLPRKDPASTTIQLIVLGALVAVGAVVARMRRGNAGPVLFAAAVFLVYYGFLKLSPLIDEHSYDYNAQRLHYAVYVTIPATIAFAHLRLPRRAGATLGRWAPRPRLGRLLQVVGCLAVTAFLLVTNNGYLERHWQSAATARAYLDAVRAGAGQWSDPGVTLVPLHGPTAMATSWSAPLARHEALLPLVDRNYAPHDVGSRFVLIDSSGTTRRALLDQVRPDVDVIGGKCASSGRGTVEKADVSFAPVSGGALLLLLRYQASGDLDLTVNAGLGTGWRPGTGTTHLAAGRHTRLVPIESDRVQTLDLRTSGGALCVRDAVVVQPLLPVGDGTICRTVDRFGRPTAWLPCP